MQPAAATVADVHIRAFTNGFYAAKNLNVAGIIFMVFHLLFPWSVVQIKTSAFVIIGRAATFF
jgi:hypothetical protein